MSIRLKDLAKALNLSVSTVSAALKNRSDISAATRKLVLEKAREMNYQPNWLARSLVTRKTQVLGVVVPDLSRSFFTEVAKGIDIEASKAGYQLVICNTGEDQQREDRELTTLIGKHVDGLILASARPPGSRLSHHLLTAKVPFVLVDRYFSGVSFVGCDDEKIGRLATGHLIAQGYRRIAHIRGPNISTAIGRWKGYLGTMRKHGLRVPKEYVVEAPYHEESNAADAMAQLLRLPTPPDAVFAASDPIAIGALQAIFRASLNVPQDVGVIGVGNARYGPFLRVPLSTINQHRTEIGKTAATVLLEQIKGKSKSRNKVVLIEPTLIGRESTQRSGHGAPDALREATVPAPPASR
jgi:LacI family transcriptional regulator